MSWNYISSMDEYDKEVSKDSSTKDRYTFRRYLYFEPSQYDQWMKGGNYSGIPYTAELVGNPNIPSAGTHLDGSLSAFYVNDVVSIINLSEEEHGDHCSYAQVTIEYENKKADSGSGGESGGGSSESQPSRGLKPWERKVDDFQVTNQEIQVPMTEAYEYDEDDYVPVATTAGQVLYGFTCSVWIQRLTWTFNSRSGDYSIPSAIVNSSDVTLFNKFTIPSNCGLLLPPGYRKMYYYEEGDEEHPTEYDQWNFEIIVNTSSQRFDIPILNAGTKAIIDNNLVDICTWYVYDPSSSSTPIQKEFGSFADMMDAKKQVDQFNKNITDESQKKVWHGDYVQSPIPITQGGEIDLQAIDDPTLTHIRWYTQYEEGSWNLGIR